MEEAIKKAEEQIAPATVSDVTVARRRLVDFLIHDEYMQKLTYQQIAGVIKSASWTINQCFSAMTLKDLLTLDEINGDAQPPKESGEEA